MGSDSDGGCNDASIDPADPRRPSSVRRSSRPVASGAQGTGSGKCNMRTLSPLVSSPELCRPRTSTRRPIKTNSAYLDRQMRISTFRDLHLDSWICLQISRSADKFLDVLTLAMAAWSPIAC